MHHGATAVAALLDLRHGRHRRPAFVLLTIAPAVSADLDGEKLGQRVHHADAYAVQTARHLVALAAELAAGVQLGQDDLQSGLAVLGHDVHRDTAPVVHNPHRRIGQDGHVDGGATASQSLVHRVVHDFVDEVVQPAVTGGPDIHAGPLTNRLQTL